MHRVGLAVHAVGRAIGNAVHYVVAIFDYLADGFHEGYENGRMWRPKPVKFVNGIPETKIREFFQAAARRDEQREEKRP